METIAGHLESIIGGLREGEHRSDCDEATQSKQAYLHTRLLQEGRTEV